MKHREIRIGEDMGIVVGDAPGGNYEVKLYKLYERLVAKPGLYHVQIAHDDWCAIYQGDPCNCDPDVWVEAEPECCHPGRANGGIEGE